MADEKKQKATYPYIPTKNWWDLRKQFRRSKPTQVTSGYLQTTLGVGESRGQTLVTQLKAVGLVSADGTPSDRADDWRDDTRYPEACQHMFESVYPAELREAQPPPQPNREATKNWFMRNAGVGEIAAGQMAQFYELLAEADVSGQEKASKSRDESSKPTTPRRGWGQVTRTKASAAKETPGPKSNQERVGSSKPTISVAVQVYIPSEATPEQIDSIFASMAKHFSAAS